MGDHWADMEQSLRSTDDKRVKTLKLCMCIKDNNNSPHGKFH